MAITLMKLGNFKFSVPGLSYDRLQRRFEYRWEPMWRVGRRPAQQYLGPGEEALDIRGIVYPHCTGGYNQLNLMRDAAQTGLPMTLTAVQGEVGIYLGPWCVRMIRDEQEYFFPDGAPRKVEFSMDLVVYGNEQGTFGGGWGMIPENWIGAGVRSFQ
jgi:phage tail protein